MLLTRHFVFVHVPKTGGNFVRAVVRDYAPEDWAFEQLADHQTHADVPATHAHLPRLAFVRNPYAWYVSWFYFQRKKMSQGEDGVEPFFLDISEDGRLGFADSMRRALASRDALQHGEGPFLQLLGMMLGPGLEGARVGKMENIRSDLRRLLAECCEVPAAMAAAIEALPRVNPSEHDHYSRYYDDELRDLVYRKDQPIFDYFGYEWADAPERKRPGE